MNILWGVRARVTLVAVLPALVLASLLVGLYYTVRSSELEETYLSRGSALARQLSAATEYALFSGNRDTLQQQTTALLGEEGVLSVRIYDRHQMVLATSGNSEKISSFGPDANLPVQRVAGIFRITQPIHTSRIEIDDDYMLLRSGAFSDQGEPIGHVVLELSAGLLQAQRRQLLISGMLTVAGVLLASLLLALRMSRQVSGPIREVAEVVQRIGRGRFEERVPVLGGGSLRSLAHGVNQMARELAGMHEDMNRRINEATSELRTRKDEAEQANTAKSRFLAAASHDLRQPMHALGLFIAELSECKLSPRARQLQEQIAASAAAMEQLLEALLDISKLDAGVMQPNLQHFPLADLLARITVSQQRIASEQKVRLLVRNCDSSIHTDPLLLERIITNLISNAITHGSSGGVVLVACRRRKERVVLEVRDNGPGIAPEAQNIIFQEFVQLENPARSRDRGLGLGLAIVRRLSDLLRLELKLRSAPGKGSTFSITLPATTQENGQNEIPSHPVTANLKGLVIAILEDDQLALEAISSLLDSWGCLVMAGDTVEKLLEQIRGKAPPAIILSDYRLGEIDGIAAIEQVRSALGLGIPAALITGDTAPEVLKRTRHAGLPVLHKPLRPARLRAFINRCAQRNSH